jgi:flavin-dependent dehydrogenase
MVSGELAARAVQASPSVATLAARYSRACDDEIGAELQDSVRIQRFLFADRRRIARLIDGAHRERQVARLVLDFVVGSCSYRDLRRRILSRSPALLLSFMWACLTTTTVPGEHGVSRT